MAHVGHLSYLFSAMITIDGNLCTIENNHRFFREPMASFFSIDRPVNQNQNTFIMPTVNIISVRTTVMQVDINTKVKRNNLKVPVLTAVYE